MTDEWNFFASYTVASPCPGSALYSVPGTSALTSESCYHDLETLLPLWNPHQAPLMIGLDRREKKLSWSVTTQADSDN